MAHFLHVHHSLLAAQFDSAERMLPRMALPEVMELHNLGEAIQPAADPLLNEQQQKNCNCRLIGVLPNADNWKKLRAI